jgi:lipid-binding SYLF domain-containing protein
LTRIVEDGYYVDQSKTDQPASATVQDGPKAKPKVLVKIPTKVIQNAVGLAIFSTCRTGLWVSGAGGSGVLVARKEDGSWSPPSGILIHTAGVGFMAGIDIYDCVVVINSREALEGFKKLRVTLGGEVSVVAGPLGVGGIVDSEVHKRQAAVFTYMKSRGLYAGVQVDGTIIIERNDENARFYGTRVPAAEILAGRVNAPPETRMLTEILKSAEGKSDVDSATLNELNKQPTPGDCEVERTKEPTEEEKQAYAAPPHAPA